MAPPHLRVVGEPIPACEFLRIFRGEHQPWQLAAINRATKDAKWRAFIKSDTRDADMLAWAAKWNAAKYDIYFSINPVKRAIPSKPTKEDISSAQWLGADLDPPGDLPSDDLDVWRAGKLLEIKEKARPASTMVIDSGRGFWLFWRLHDTPVDGRGPLTEAVEAYGRGIGAVFGADNCFNIDRIARLPGFINHKTGKQAAVLRYDPSEVYRLTDFPAAPTRQRQPELTVDSELVDDETARRATVAYLDAAEVAVEGHGGRARALQVFQRCMDLGCSESVALDLMEEYWMPRCSPPWDRDEFEHTARSLKRNDPIGVHHPTAIADYRNELARKEFEHVAPKPGDLTGTFYHFPDPSSIPPREFLYGGHYVRQFVSATIAPTKVGKSSLGIAEALAMASGKPLLGVEPRGQFRVRIWNGEDPWDEMVRRIAAAIKHYGLTREDLGDRLLVDSGREMPIILATQMRSGAMLAAPVVAEIVRALTAQKVDVLLIDPFIASHRISENDNNAVEVVAKAWAHIADQTRCAVELVHHSRKLNGGEASIEDARGASALVSAVRSARALSKMTKTEADRLGVRDLYRGLFRFADTSSNMAPVSTAEEEKWLQLWSVGLNNGRGPDALDAALNGDSVGVVRSFDMPAEAERIMRELGGTDGGTALIHEARAVEILSSGEWRADIRAGDAWAGRAIISAFGLDADKPEDRAHAKMVLKAWTRLGKIREESRMNKDRKPKTYIVPVIQVVSTDLFGEPICASAPV